MSKKFEAIKKAIFYSEQDPSALASIISGTVTDVVTSVSVTGATEIDIPTGETANTEDYTATVLSQFGDAMEGQTVTFTVTSATGVSISDNTVSIANTASAGTITVTATCSGKTGTIDVTLKVAN